MQRHPITLLVLLLPWAAAVAQVAAASDAAPRADVAVGVERPQPPTLNLPDLGDLKLPMPRALVAINALAGMSRQRLALVVGNGSVGNDAALASTSRDTQAVAAALRAGGFVVMVREDLGADALRENLQEFRRRLQPGGIGFVYVNGIGAQVDGRNYLLPRGLALPAAGAEAALAAAALPLQEVVDAAQGTADSPRYLVVDAAYAHPMVAVLAQPGLAEQKLPPGMMGLFATAAGVAVALPAADALATPAPTDPRQIAASPFGRELVRSLVTPRVSGADALRLTRGAVLEASAGKQLPVIVGDVADKTDFAEPNLLDVMLPRSPEEAAREALQQATKLGSTRAGDVPVSQITAPAPKAAPATPAAATNAETEAAPAADAQPPATPDGSQTSLAQTVASTAAQAAVGVATTVAAGVVTTAAVIAAGAAVTQAQSTATATTAAAATAATLVAGAAVSTVVAAAGGVVSLLASSDVTSSTPAAPAPVAAASTAAATTTVHATVAAPAAATSPVAPVAPTASAALPAPAAPAAAAAPAMPVPPAAEPSAAESASSDATVKPPPASSAPAATLPAAAPTAPPLPPLVYEPRLPVGALAALPAMAGVAAALTLSQQALQRAAQRQVDDRTRKQQGGGERPSYTPRVNPYGYAEGDSFTYQVRDVWRDQLVGSTVQTIDEVLDGGDLVANGAQTRLDPQGRVRSTHRADGSASQYEPCEDLWWSNPQRGQSRSVSFQERFQRADASRGETDWKGSMRVGQPSRITLPAGTFDVLPIAGGGWYHQHVGGQLVSGQWTRTVWYAPELGHPVAIDIEDANAVGKLLRRERIELTHAQTSRTAAP